MAQAVTDTLFTWQGYGRASTCRVRIYRAAGRRDRSYVVVVQELAENRGPSTLEDVPYLAEQVGRQFGVDPVEAYWVYHWGGFSYSGAPAGRKKEVFLQATFRRTQSRALGAPSWRLIRRSTVEDYTDRLFR
jgi:hypothetical protein